MERSINKHFQPTAATVADDDAKIEDAYNVASMLALVEHAADSINSECVGSPATSGACRLLR
jgi:hypothetical protein